MIIDLKIKKQGSGHVSRVLFPTLQERRCSVIYLVYKSPCNSSVLPSIVTPQRVYRAGTLQRWYT